MALALAKAGPLKPEIRLSQALVSYERVLSAEQKLAFSDRSNRNPDTNAVMVLTCEIDRQNAGRKTRRCGARLTSFLNSVKGFTSVMDLIVSGTANPIAGTVWSAVKVAIQASMGFESYFDALSKMLMNIGLNSPRFETYKLLFPASSALQAALCSYHATVVSLCTKIVLFVRKPLARQIASALRKPFDDEFGSLQKDLTTLGETVKEEVALASRQQQSLEFNQAAQERKEASKFREMASAFRKDVSKELFQAKIWREEKLKAQFLNACSKYNAEISLNQARKKGSSTWIFDDLRYQEWISSTTSATLFCSGILGSGKTVLCANVVEDLVLHQSSSSCSVAYFFCRSDEAISLKAREILGSLARQLFQSIPSSILQLGQLESISTFSLEQLLSTMLYQLPPQQYILLIDGLDECEVQEVNLLFEHLPSLWRANSKQSFKLFWTGQEYRGSARFKRICPDFYIKITSSNNGPEISKFIRAALDDAMERDMLILGDPNIILQIQAALEEKAQNMFLWVVFQIESICALNTDHEIISSLNDLPKNLPATFRRILHRLQRSDSADTRRARLIFELITAAQRPLTLDELREAISITPGDISWDQSKLVNDILKSLRSCGSFLVIDEELSTVHFAHSSLKQHLLSKPTVDDIRDYHITLPEADARLGEIIVTYLNLGVLGRQVSKIGQPSKLDAATIPSTVVESTLKRHETARKVALRLIRSKDPKKISTVESGAASKLSNRRSILVPDIFAFLPYCQQHWLFHTKSIDVLATQNPKLRDTYRLWGELTDGKIDSVESPWSTGSGGAGVDIEMVMKTHHAALIRKTARLLYQAMALPITKFQGVIPSKLNSLLSCQACTIPELTRIMDMSGELSAGGANLVLRGALQYECNDVAQLALSSGADPNSTNSIVYTDSQGPNKSAVMHALQAAALLPLMQGTLEMLLEKGAAIDAQSGAFGTALIAASASNNVRAALALLKKGANTELKSPSGGTAIELAAASNSLATVRVLLEYGAEIDETCMTISAFMREYRTDHAVAELLHAHLGHRYRFKIQSHEWAI